MVSSVEIGREGVAAATPFVIQLTRLAMATFLSMNFFLPWSLHAANMTSTQINPLSFGTVVQGVTETVQVSDAGAGAFSINITKAGAGSHNAQLTFIPNLASGGHVLSVVFASNLGAWSTTSSLTGSTAFDPSTGFTATFRAQSTTFYVWIGGTANPSSGQAIGNYTGTISFSLKVDGVGVGTGGSINASASVIPKLSVSPTSGNLLFGNLQDMIVKGAVGGSDTVIVLNGTDNRAVNFSVSGQPQTSVSITIPISATLTGSPNGGSITFTPSVAYNSSNTSATGSTGLTNGGIFSLGTTGTQYVWIGGSIASPSAAPPGTYSGTLTLTITYFGI